jgi:hypothetical protein
LSLELFDFLGHIVEPFLLLLAVEFVKVDFRLARNSFHVKLGRSFILLLWLDKLFLNCVGALLYFRLDNLLNLGL